MSSYYFVRTPLQYLNALEAKLENRFQQDNHFLILLSDYDKTLAQLAVIIRPDLWTEISFIWEEFSAHKKNKLLNAFALFKRKTLLDNELKKIKPSDVVFWSNINSNWFFYTYKKLPNKLYLLDDGFATLPHLMPFDMEDLKKSIMSSKSAKIERIILRPNFQLNWNKLVFYTNLSFYSSEKNTIYHHFENLSKMITKRELTKEVYFIGQPLIYRKMMTKDNYVSRVTTIFEYYKNQDLKPIYIPHRSTPLNYIPKSWEVRELEYPLEFLLIVNKCLPCRFATFYSAGLYNLELLSNKQDTHFDYWQVEKDEIMNYPFENIAYLYKLLKQTESAKRHFHLNKQNNEAKVR
jgi:hypothetical protein